MSVDVHQHLWTPGFLAALRSRTAPPCLEGWTLHLDGEPPYEVDPRDHDLAGRLALNSGLDLALVSLSSPLGVESLPPGESWPVIDAYHEDVLALPVPFGAWAATCLTDVDPARLAAALDRGLAGLQLPATAVGSAAGLRAAAPLLDVLVERNLPLFVHPGPAGGPGSGPGEGPADGPDSGPGGPGGPGGGPGGGSERGSGGPGDAPGWWPAVVPYVQQMHAAWFAFAAFGRPRHPRLRVCFALLAGLAPLHSERLARRGGGTRGVVDTGMFVETSSYGPRAVDAVVRELGVDVVVSGSDLPYATAPDLSPALGDAAWHAVSVANPARLLHRKESRP
ncbi:amidohydrolase [Planomonospora sphaerica]|uniref:Amidohydrolase n=1 Tax=Planomonospora sphaerica TaxID=161355 RepID=A0A171CZA5_9ACTN|nr:amidohydrolase family protein [Planomonospora sphaerica]GAT67450.1 amidohydrolase [Planomonospora sphaerica]